MNDAPRPESECHIRMQRVVVDVPKPWLWRCLTHNLGGQEFTTEAEAWQSASSCGATAESYERRTANITRRL